MGRKALIAVLCWLTLNDSSAKPAQTADGQGQLVDNVSAESVSSLYRNVPVYASGTPYASYSFNVPQFLSPNSYPFKEERLVAQSTNNFLKDSYGQRFVEAPQSYAYKASLPQQFVPLQTLPAHLKQPLAAAAPSMQYGQATHFFGPSVFKLGDLQAFAPQYANSYGAAQPLVYAANVRSLTATPQQQSTINKNVYINNLTADQYNKLREEPTFQIIQQEPRISANRNKQSEQLIEQKLPLVHAPKQTTITTITNGKKTVVNLITKPPVPLLDLTLLEPLTFDNPLVPQVQHFLPRIHQVKYEKLPELNQVKKHQKVYMVQNTESFNRKAVKKPKKSSKKKQKKQPPKDVIVNHIPTVTVHESRQESPEISYEINSPNYKETISEKKVSYNKETESEPINISYVKETNSQPVHYSYEKHTQKEPVNYNYEHSSNEPVQMKQAYYDTNNQNPKHLIYHFTPEEKNNQNYEPQNNPANQFEAEEISVENSNNRDREELLPQQQQQYQKQQVQPQQESQQQPQQQHSKAQHELAEEALDEITYIQPVEGEEVYIQNSKEAPQPQHRENVYYQSLKKDAKPEGREEVYYEIPEETPSDGHQRFAQRSVDKAPTQEAKKQFRPKAPEFEDNISAHPTHKPRASLNAGAEHNQDSHNKQNLHPKKQHEQVHYNQPKSYAPPLPIVHEKSKSIIIKEESPQEEYIPNDELVAAMIKKQEKSEEDFEKAYKDAAYGFPAYESVVKDSEKAIYDPTSYGVSRLQEFEVESSPLRQYEAEGDEYPTETRSKYKDSRDKTNGDYYFDYAVSRPESLVERHRKKENYYNNYMEHSPQKYYAKKDADIQESAKYVAAPTYVYHTAPPKKLAKLKYTPKLEEYYAKQVPHDSSAFATGPLHLHTQFVGPQYQYGFGPLVLDSELAVMASNDSPKNEKPGTRKKVYKENFYIKKASTAKGAKETS